MGAKNSTPKQKLNIDHERFTHAELNSESNQIDSFIAINFSQFDYEYWLKNLHQIKKDPNSKLLFLPLSQDKIHSSFKCSINPQLKLSFQNYPFLLESQIKNRTANYQQNHFGERELWMLLYSLVKSQKAFQNLSVKVGDIHPHSIFINEEGWPRLACQFSWPNEKTDFQKMYYDKKLCFLSPEQLRLLQQGECPDICYSKSSEAFSIGMTILSAGLLDSLDRICDIKTFKFNQKYLDYCINRWMSLKSKQEQTNQIISYSDQLKDIVKNLCHLDPRQRYLSAKVYELLEPYEQKIMNIEKFELKNYGGMKKSLSPYLESSKIAQHKKLFDKYAGLSGEKPNDKMKIESELSNGRNTTKFLTLHNRKIEDNEQQKRKGPREDQNLFVKTENQDTPVKKHPLTSQIVSGDFTAKNP